MNTEPDGAINLAGWHITANFVSNRDSAGASGHFYAVYGGDAFGHAERGIIAMMARGHPDNDPAGASEAAQLVAHGVAEGYFGAPRTFSPQRAIGLAVHSINRWLAAQRRNDSIGHLAPVSLTTIIFNGPIIGIAHSGTCRLYRQRHGKITPLLRHAPEQGPAPMPGIGCDRELPIAYQEEPVEARDRYLLTSGLAEDRNEAWEAAFNLDVRALGDAAQPLALLVLDVVSCPPPNAVGLNAELAHLPLRAAPREGDSWDGFVIGKTLHHGRYTVLKAAYDTIEHRQVALKIALPSMVQDQIFAAGFMRESWIGAAVRGTHVARYVDLPPERRTCLYLVLPLYQGETLEVRLHRAPAVSLQDGIGIALQLCEAVQDLAAIQIIHCDLKPENVMVLDHNEIKLLDLGLAYLPGIDMAEAAKPGGTLRYMAPEIVQGVQANARTEVYALAVTLYRMFSGGAYPFGQREAVPLTRLRPDLPSWLGRILQQALSPDPVNRFADAGALALALHAALVNGVAEPSHTRSRLTELQIWQALAVIFAIGFLGLLLRALR